MKFGVSLPNFGEFADPAVMVELAVLAENAGWDGFFVWDHIVVGDGVAVGDPWVQLGAIAQATDRIALGPMVTPLPRRRPWVVARQATSVDHLSDGRLILGVGIGFPPDEEFATFGEPTGDRERADMLDDGLAVLAGMWSAAPFGYEGTHYSVRTATFAPPPVQRPIPIWVAAMWPNRRPLRRAARYQGAFPVKMDMSPWTPDEVAELHRFLQAQGPPSPLNVVIGGTFDAEGDLIAAYADAGATWFIVGPMPGDSLEELRRTLDAGPPRPAG